MQKIHQLPEHIIAQIAAGEVIERPAYALKELVENAIDAKADDITIHIDQAGMKKIIVIDNGEGMSRADVELSVRHHTTSKLDDTFSLHGIKSLGFRGEALSSIAAVSTMTIKSRPSTQTAGTILQLNSGTITKLAPIGIPQGTSVHVEQLFSSIPARKKFLKTQRTEFRRIVDLLLQITIAYPGIRFHLTHNDKTIFDFPKADSAAQRLSHLLGNETLTQMIPFTFDDSYLHISGFLSKPHVASTTTQKQFLFINNRPVTDRLIAQAVKEAYGSMLDATSYPIFVLFLKLPHEMVDVNVHPRKEQVTFLNNQHIYETVRAAIEKTLTDNNLTFFTMKWQSENMPSHATQTLRKEILPWQIQHLSRAISSADISQFHNVYLLTQTYNGIFFIDQHAADERILYEKFSKAYQKQKKNKKLFSLPKGLSIELSLSDKQTLDEYRNVFSSYGFEITDFGPTTIQIVQVPYFFKDHAIRELFLELLVDIKEQGQAKATDTQSQKMLAFLACRSAIKAGDKLTKKQCKELIKTLEETPNNYTCPHGRPTKIEMSLSDIHKLFKRR